MKLAVHTIEKTLFDGDVTSITIKTEAGEITVLENHLPLVTLTRPGFVRVVDRAGKVSTIDMSSFGFLEVRPENEGAILLAG